LQVDKSSLTSNLLEAWAELTPEALWPVLLHVCAWNILDMTILGAVLDIFRDERILENVNARGKQLMDALRKFQQKYISCLILQQLNITIII